MSRKENFKSRGETFQHSLFDRETDLELYLIQKGTVVWLKRRGRGVTQHPVLARRVEEKIKGLTGFEALNPVILYLDGKHWTLQKGMRFGAYMKNVRKVKK